MDCFRNVRYPGVAEVRIGSVVRAVLSSLNEFFDKISNDQSTSTIEMDAVRMKAPAIDLGDFVGASAQHQSAESIAIERKKPTS